MNGYAKMQTSFRYINYASFEAEIRKYPDNQHDRVKQWILKKCCITHSFLVEKIVEEKSVVREE